MKLGISFAKTITYQLRWFVMFMEVETSSWYVGMFLELRHIELNRCKIYYSPNDCQMNNKSHDFYLYELLCLTTLVRSY